VEQKRIFIIDRNQALVGKLQIPASQPICMSRDDLTKILRNHMDALSISMKSTGMIQSISHTVTRRNRSPTRALSRDVC
jgi:hypothetical protein